MSAFRVREGIYLPPNADIRYISKGDSLPTDFTLKRPMEDAETKLDSKFLVQMTRKMSGDLTIEARRRGISRNALVRNICEKYLDDATVS